MTWKVPVFDMFYVISQPFLKISSWNFVHIFMRHFPLTNVTVFWKFWFWGGKFWKGKKIVENFEYFEVLWVLVLLPEGSLPLLQFQWRTIDVQVFLLGLWFGSGHTFLYQWVECWPQGSVSFLHPQSRVSCHAPVCSVYQGVQFVEISPVEVQTRILWFMSLSVTGKVKTEDNMIALAETGTVLHVLYHASFICEHQVQGMCPFALPEPGGFQYMLLEEQVLGAVNKPLGEVTLRCRWHSQFPVNNLSHVKVTSAEQLWVPSSRNMFEKLDKIIGVPFSSPWWTTVDTANEQAVGTRQGKLHPQLLLETTIRRENFSCT